jgi:galactokinase
MSGKTASGAKERALVIGREVFGSGWRPDRIALAPGRLELLGNHVDYNGGAVLAAAIDRTVVVAAASGGSNRAGIDVVMADTPDRDRALLRPQDLVDWRNPNPPPAALDYVRGAVAAALVRPGVRIPARARLAVAGDVPIGFGLSSSAALCVALTLALHDPRPDDRELILRAQEAEHRAGTPCGTLDQSASVGGGVIRYDGTTLDNRRLEPDLGDLVFAVADSGVNRSLGASSYPKRVAESAEALAVARRLLHRDFPNLAAVGTADLAQLERQNPDQLSPLLLKRIRHVVTETARVEQGIRAMTTGDWPAFGRLMTASGRSSALDYEISHPRVEELVAEALSLPGVLGARMMGGGEGGTALILLPRSLVPVLTDRLARGYYTRHALADASHRVHVFGFSPGARIELG